MPRMRDGAQPSFLRLLVIDPMRSPRLAPTALAVPVFLGANVAAALLDEPGTPDFYRAVVTIIPTLLIALGFQSRLFAWSDPFEPLTQNLLAGARFEEDAARLEEGGTRLEELYPKAVAGDPASLAELPEAAAEVNAALEAMRDRANIFLERHETATSNLAREAVLILYRLILLILMLSGELAALWAVAFDLQDTLLLATCAAALVASFGTVAVNLVLDVPRPQASAAGPAK